MKPNRSKDYNKNFITTKRAMILLHINFCSNLSSKRKHGLDKSS